MNFIRGCFCAFGRVLCFSCQDMICTTMSIVMATIMHAIFRLNLDIVSSNVCLFKTVLKFFLFSKVQFSFTLAVTDPIFGLWIYLILVLVIMKKFNAIVLCVVLYLIFLILTFNFYVSKQTTMSNLKNSKLFRKLRLPNSTIAKTSPLMQINTSIIDNDKILYQNFTYIFFIQQSTFRQTFIAVKIKTSR